LAGYPLKVTSSDISMTASRFTISLTVAAIAVI
jgi:hypothetical protein